MAFCAEGSLSFGISSYSPDVEVYSIDESFLDLTGMDVDFKAYAEEISRECWRRTSIPVSVGIAPTKTLAKIASKLCKKYPKLNGGCYMYRPEDIEKVLHRFPAEDVWGIGRRSLRKLEGMGVHTAWDYTQLPESTVRSIFHLPGFRTWMELRGTPCIEFEDMIEPKQSICVSRSFSHEVTTLQEFTEQITTFAGKAVEKLRAQNSHVRSLFSDPAAEERDARLSESIDAINRAFGGGSVLFGVQGDGRFHMAQDHKSPHYTTRWEDIPTVKIR